MFLFHLKSSFRSRDIQICVCSSSVLFLPVSHCFTGWSKKNLKVFDVINSLNKYLITHFVWYLEKKIRCDIETLPIDRVFNKEDYQKALKKLTLFFLSSPVPFNEKSYQKQKGSGTSAQSLSRSQNKFRKIPLFSI